MLRHLQIKLKKKFRKSKSYRQKQSTKEAQTSKNNDVKLDDLFDSLEINLTHLNITGKLLLKQREHIAQLLKSSTTDANPSLLYDKLKSVDERSKIYINTLNEHGILSENFIFYAYKLYLRLIAVKDSSSKEKKRETIKKNSKNLSRKKLRSLSKDSLNNKLNENKNQKFKQLEFETNLSSGEEVLDEEFFDTLSDFPEHVQKNLLIKENNLNQKQRQRRVEIPPKLKNSSFSFLLTILKNSIGKDLTRISFPATFFSEPITFLQRHTEFLEYSYLLDKASKCKDSLEQMTYVSAFSISVFNLHVDRNSKPFNPLLNESFECDRLKDFKWRSFSEQVQHHPPRLALHAESLNGWTFSFDQTVSTKFKGTYVEVVPVGKFHLHFQHSNNYYTWNFVNSYVNGLLLGKISISQQGEINIFNHKTKEICTCWYHKEPTFFSSEKPHRITAIIKDSNELARYVLEGAYVEKVECSLVRHPQKVNSFEEINFLDLYKRQLLWKRNFIDSKYKNMYNFTPFAIELNELEPNIAPTDSRLRPDIRLMEESKWDDANQKKIYLEDKQRQRLSNCDTEPDPCWFKKVLDTLTNEERYVFTEEYWDCKKIQEWERSPQIF